MNDLQESISSSNNDIQPPPTKLFLNKNNEFLEKEISFFITNLRSKAKVSGLDEDMLIPMKNKRDMQIYSYVQSKDSQISRPQTASTINSSKQNDMTINNDAFSSTFVSNMECEGLPEIPKDKCVLDFGKSEIEILHEISNLIKQETLELESKIQLQQDIIMNGGRPKSEDIVDQIEEPSAKELFEFKNKLEETYLNSESNKTSQEPLIDTSHKTSLILDQKSQINTSMVKNKFKPKIKLAKQKLNDPDEENIEFSRSINKSSIKIKRAMTTNPNPRKATKIKLK